MAQIKADEVTKILREQIEGYQQKLSVEETGTVISVGDGIARIHGLDKCMAGEMIEFPNDVFGIALNLDWAGRGRLNVYLGALDLGWAEARNAFARGGRDGITCFDESTPTPSIGIVGEHRRLDLA